MNDIVLGISIEPLISATPPGYDRSIGDRVEWKRFGMDVPSLGCANFNLCGDFQTSQLRVVVSLKLSLSS